MRYFNVLVFILLVVSCTGTKDDVPVQVPTGTRLNVDSVDALEKEYRPIARSLDSSYHTPDYAIILPDRLDRFEFNYFSATDMAKRIYDNSLPPELRRYIVHALIEADAGYFKLTQEQREWLTNNPDEARQWWSQVKDQQGGLDFFLDSSNIGVPYSKHGSYQLIEYFRKRAEITGSTELLTREDLTHEWLTDDEKLVAKLFSIQRKYVFRAPPLKTEDQALCSEIIFKSSSEKELMLQQHAQTYALDDEVMGKIKNWCFDGLLQPAYWEETSSDFIYKSLNENPQNFVDNELFSTKAGEKKVRIPDYDEALVQRIYQDMKQVVPESYKEKLAQAALIISYDDEVADSLFHALSDEKGTIISPVLVRASTAQCRQQQVIAASFHESMERKQERYRNVFNYDYEPPRSVNYRLRIDNGWGETTKKFADIAHAVNKAVQYPDYHLYEVNWKENFESCVSQTLSLLFSHELAHIYMPNASEGQVDCIAANLILKAQNNNNVSFSKGKEFLSVVLLNAIQGSGRELWGWTDDNTTAIENRFRGLNEESCKEVALQMNTQLSIQQFYGS